MPGGKPEEAGLEGVANDAASTGSAPFAGRSVSIAVGLVKGAEESWGVLGEAEADVDVEVEEDEECSLGLEVSGVGPFFEGRGEGGEC